MENSTKYRVWHISNVPSEPKYYEVVSPGIAKDIIRKLVRFDLQNPDVDSNAFGLEGLNIDGVEGWSEWNDPETGRDIMETIDEEDEELPGEIEAVLAELQNWHSVRGGLNDKPDRRKRLNMGTLPRAIALLQRFRNEQSL